MAAHYRASKHPLPSGWETRAAGAGNERALRYLKVDGLQVKYIGPGEDDSQAASLRANYPCPLDLPVFYFEVEVRRLRAPRSPGRATRAAPLHKPAPPGATAQQRCLDLALRPPTQHQHQHHRQHNRHQPRPPSLSPLCR